jgi:hypothetical protein
MCEGEILFHKFVSKSAVEAEAARVKVILINDAIAIV